MMRRWWGAAVLGGLIVIASCVGSEVETTDQAGRVNQPCLSNGTCDVPLACVAGICRPTQDGGLILDDAGQPMATGNDGGDPPADARADGAPSGDDAGAPRPPCDVNGTERFALIADLSPDSVIFPETKAPSTANGKALLVYDPNNQTLCGRMSFALLDTAGVYTAHLHAGVMGVAGEPPLEVATSNASPITMNGTLDLATHKKVCDASLYIDVHTGSDGPSIRGQLRYDPNRAPEPCP